MGLVELVHGGKKYVSQFGRQQSCTQKLLISGHILYGDSLSYDVSGECISLYCKSNGILVRENRRSVGFTKGDFV